MRLAIIICIFFTVNTFAQERRLIEFWNDGKKKQEGIIKGVSGEQGVR